MAQLNKCIQEIWHLSQNILCSAEDTVDCLKTNSLRWQNRWCHFCDPPQKHSQM